MIASSSVEKSFGYWQLRYAEVGVPTFPVSVGVEAKKPLVLGYLKTDLIMSAQFAKKFAGASSFGFPCGPLSGITIIDVDSPDPAIWREVERRVGQSPVAWTTSSGHLALAFRHNGEGRSIRPWADLPVDVLGGGYAVAPPSAGAPQQYQIIRGGLHDLRHLPIASIPDLTGAKRIRRDRKVSAPIPDGQRHVSLKEQLMSHVWACDDFETLLDCARGIGKLNCDPPMDDQEIERLATWFWTGRTEGWLHRPGYVHWTKQARDLMIENRDAGVLYFILRQQHPGEDHQFVVANAMHRLMKMDKILFAKHRAHLAARGLIVQVRPHTGTSPAIYRWPSRIRTQQTEGAPSIAPIGPESSADESPEPVRMADKDL